MLIPKDGKNEAQKMVHFKSKCGRFALYKKHTNLRTLGKCYYLMLKWQSMKRNIKILESILILVVMQKYGKKKPNEGQQYEH